MKKKTQKKKLSRQEARNGIIIGIGVSFVSWFFDMDIFGLSPNFVILYFGVLFPIVLILVPKAPKTPPEPNHHKSTKEPEVTPFAPKTAPKRPVRPVLQEPAVDAARRLGVPAILLQPHHPLLSRSETSSWFGGFPKLPDHILWPREPYGEKRPLHFMAQINCATLPVRAAQLHGFPTSGHLCFFSEIYEMSETGAVIYFEDDIAHLSPRMPPEDSLPIFGSNDYSTPFNEGQPPIDRAGLPHPSAMPMVPVQPFEFMSYPNFSHMFSTSALFERPKLEDQDAQKMAAELEAQRTSALIAALNYDPLAAKTAYETLIMGPAHPEHTQGTQYAGLSRIVAEVIMEQAQNALRREKAEDKRQQLEHIHALASVLAAGVKDLPFFQELNLHAIGKIGELKQAWLNLYPFQGPVPQSYFHVAKSKLRYHLFNALVNPGAFIIPEKVRPALMWFQNPVHFPTFSNPKFGNTATARGIFQMGGYCHGSQHDSHPTTDNTPLLVVGYCELTGFKYGDVGEWTFNINPQSLQVKDFSEIKFAADCH